ncbi:UNVERIFIED_CONTAM: hypothetical protein Sradi_2347500 [Sesamum radiatum]|uniref:Uncharacterized protein n=1 Tax=Sesamum radiatum TaxID=300843 RepID=A0AAW2T6S5_SESRA
MVISRDAVLDEQFMLQQHQDKMPKDSSSSDTLQMELEPHSVAPENRGGSHPSSNDPVAVESSGSSLPTSGGSTTKWIGSPCSSSNLQLNSTLLNTQFLC